MTQSFASPQTAKGRRQSISAMLWCTMAFFSTGGPDEATVSPRGPVAMTQRAWAQHRAKMSRITLFHPTHPHSAMSEHGGLTMWQALFQELRRLGYEEGRNLTVERYTGGGQSETYPQLAKKVVATHPDLIFSWG